jgi:hypothetical protein
MTIHWGRILNAGLVAEILLLGIYQLVAWRYGNRGLAAMTVIIAGSFLFMAVGAIWVARKIESRFILHGFLVGIVAVLYYVIRSLPDLLGGRYPDYVQLALVGHTPKILGGLVGGFLAARSRKAKGITASNATKTAM